MEKLEFEGNLELVKLNGSLNSNGIVNLDIELLKTLENARAYLVARYGKDFKNVAFNRSININKAVKAVGVTPLALAIMGLIKNSIDTPFVFPVPKV